MTAADQGTGLGFIDVSCCEKRQSPCWKSLGRKLRSNYFYQNNCSKMCEIIFAILYTVQK